VHAYEGRGLEPVTFATRVMGRLGARVLALTNAAGGVNVRFGAGTLMAIDDHLNLMGVNPLVGPNDDRVGPRFPDMSEVYSRRLRAAADAASAASGVPLEHGVYAAVMGPSYETPAEVRALRALGADAVGMSTVPEALVARHMGLKVFGLSCIANPGAGVTSAPLSADEVLTTAARVQGPLARLLEAFIARI
jgi:purine-nucleoside phosphorylase